MTIDPMKKMLALIMTVIEGKLTDGNWTLKLKMEKNFWRRPRKGLNALTQTRNLLWKDLENSGVTKVGVRQTHGVTIFCP